MLSSNGGSPLTALTGRRDPPVLPKFIQKELREETFVALLSAEIASSCDQIIKANLLLNGFTFFLIYERGLGQRNLAPEAPWPDSESLEPDSGASGPDSQALGPDSQSLGPDSQALGHGAKESGLAASESGPAACTIHPTDHQVLFWITPSFSSS